MTSPGPLSPQDCAASSTDEAKGRPLGEKLVSFCEALVLPFVLKSKGFPVSCHHLGMKRAFRGCTGRAGPRVMCSPPGSAEGTLRGEVMAGEPGRGQPFDLQRMKPSLLRPSCHRCQEARSRTCVPKGTSCLGGISFGRIETAPSPQHTHVHASVFLLWQNKATVFKYHS